MTRRRLLRLSLPAIAGFALGAVPAIASEDVVATIAERAGAHGVDADRLVALARCESGLDPRAVGSLGEVGLYQLAPFGLLPHFRRVGYRDHWSVWEQADYVARAFAGEWLDQGVGPRHWSCH